MTDYPKRLIEVDLPIKRISAHARREKSIRHGHISTLHIWWARRPLAACRAVICAALWPDPADPNCPKAFRDAAARLITEFANKVLGQGKIDGQSLLETCSPESLGRWEGIVNSGNPLDPTDEAHQNVLRFALLDFIADFSNWDNSTVPAYLETARALTQAAHEALGGEPDTRPLVVDPFAGGGSIPFEALRVGADTFASDLNPVAVLLNKVLLEYIPKYGQRLADEVSKWGAWVQEQAEKELAEFYPKDPDGARPIAYLWARTIKCEGPGCGALIPLVQSLWLSKKRHRPVALRPVIDRESRRVQFEIWTPPQLGAVERGTVRRGSACCLVCGFTSPVESVRTQLSARRGGSSDAQMICVVTVRDNERGRYYREPKELDLAAAATAAAKLADRVGGPDKTGNELPSEELPLRGTLGFRVQRYGMEHWSDLFSPRQALALVTISEKVRIAAAAARSESSDDLPDAVQLLLALNLGKMADYGSALASWSSPASQETVRQTFARMALPMVWDFAEAYPFAASSGGWLHNLKYQLTAISDCAAAHCHSGTVVAADAASHPLPADCATAVITDPPYYDAIPYADLSDFFLVWLSRSLEGAASASGLPKLSPKDNECVMDRSKGHDRAYFERTMTKALAEALRYAAPGAVGVVVFAHKSTDGWEAQIQSLLDAGWVISGSWPIDTERQGRVRANSSAALASSVHLVCRPREVTDGSIPGAVVGDWRDVLAELPVRIHEWMPRLAEEGVVGADAIFACLGPALEIYSRFSRVEKSSGDVVPLADYLIEVWAAVSNEALSLIFREADASGLEPDARLTAMWLWTLGAGQPTASGNRKPVVAKPSAVSVGVTAQSADFAEEELTEPDEDEDNADDPDDAAGAKTPKVTGYVLEFDAARKIAQGLGVHLDKIESVVEVKGDKARLLPVTERARYLFGKDEGEEVKAPGRGKAKKKAKQRNMFDELGGVEEAESGWAGLQGASPGATALDRLHQTMILFGAGRGELMKRFLVDEGVGSDSRFWKLAQSLSALYPAGSDEKRWVDGVLARKKGLGL